VPTIEAPTHYPRHITGPLQTRYDHLHCLHYQLKDLWHFQLKNHRDPWSIQSAHDFWRRHGTPRTLDGRKLGWDPERNWILDGIEDTGNELTDLENDAKKRMRAIGVVMGTHHRQGRRARAGGRASAAAAAKSKSRLSAALDSAAAALSSVAAAFDEESQEMGFTSSSDVRYQTAATAAGEFDQFMPALDFPPCLLHPSNFTWHPDHHDTNYDIDGNVFDNDGFAGLPGSPEKPIIIDDDDADKNREKGEEGEEGEEEDILYFSKYFHETVCPSPVVSDDSEDPLSGSLQDYSPSMMRLDRRRHRRRLENSPEYLAGSVMREIYRGHETLAAAITTISSSSSSSSPETIQCKNSISSNSSSPRKKRTRNEQQDEEGGVEYLGEARCKKSPKGEADSDQKEPISIESVSIED
jgi:hypothetical protein